MNMIQKLLVDNNPTQIIFQTIQKQLSLKVEKSKKFGQNIKETVIKNAKELLQNQQMQMKKINEEGKKMEKELKQRIQEQDKLFVENNKKQVEYDQCKMNSSISLQLIEQSPEKKIKLNMKTDQLSKEAYELEGKVQSTIESFNAFLEVYKEKMDLLFQTMQEQDFARNQMIQQNAQSLLEYDLENGKDYQEQVDKLMEVLKQYDAQRDIDSFIRVNKSGQQFYQKRKYIPYNSYLRNSLFNFQQRQYEEINGFINNSPFIEIISGKFIPEYEKEMDQIVINDLSYKDDKFIEFYQAICYQLLQITNDGWYGKDQTAQQLAQFQEVLVKYNLSRYFWISIFQQFRVQGKFEMSSNGFINIVQLINILLNICWKKKDPFIPRKIIILSTTFYSYLDNKQKVYLYNALFYHDIWKSKNIWDTIFFEQIYEELFKQNNMEVKYEECLEIQKNTIYGLLGSVVHNMLLFDQPKSQVKDMLLKYSKIYQLSEEYTKILIVQIVCLYILQNQVEKFVQKQQKIKILVDGHSPETPSTPVQKVQQENDQDNAQNFLQNFKTLVDFASALGLKK